MTTLLIDADTIAFKAALAAEYNHDFNGTICRGADLDQAFETFRGEIGDLCVEYGTTKHRIALTGPTNFRKDVYAAYKSKRGPKPICLGELKAKIVEELGGVIKDLLEADDIVGIWATHPTLIKGEKIVVSIDKDLKTIPCAYTNGNGETTNISKSQANLFFLTQVLTGDTTDGYPGLPGCGGVGAGKILLPFLDSEGGFNAKGAWAAVVAAYEKSGRTVDDALVQARVARILRYQDYNFKTKEPILWTPPSSS